MKKDILELYADLYKMAYDNKDVKSCLDIIDRMEVLKQGGSEKLSADELVAKVNEVLGVC